MADEKKVFDLKNVSKNMQNFTQATMDDPANVAARQQAMQSSGEKNNSDDDELQFNSRIVFNEFCFPSSLSDLSKSI